MDAKIGAAISKQTSASRLFRFCYEPRRTETHACRREGFQGSGKGRLGGAEIARAWVVYVKAVAFLLHYVLDIDYSPYWRLFTNFTALLA